MARFHAQQPAASAEFRAVVVLVWLGVALVLLLQYWAQTAETLLDTDDATRLVEMRAWLAGQGWFDMHNARLRPRAATTRTGRG